MSSQSSFLIGPVKDGIRKDIKPWAIPEDSFEFLLNAYQFRGRIVKRSGYTLLGKLANGTPVMGLKTQEQFGINLQTLIAFDTINSYEWNGTAFVKLNISGTVTPQVWSGTDYQFFYTANYANAFWATNSKPGLHGATITFPGITNDVVGVNTPLVTTAFPHGFTTGQTVVFINIKGMIEINGLSATITSTPTPTTFSIDIDTSTFGIYTSNGFALNSFVSVPNQDGIRYYGVLSNGTGWANYNPPIDPNNALVGALLIFPYRGYLVFLNTTEGNEQNIDNFPNRARWTQVGTPYYSPPQPVFPNVQGVDVNAARDDLFGRGGAYDAPTNESIVGAAFIRDILVVYFTSSTWRLRFVNNSQNPFVWERINVELGSDCTGSTIPFDKGLMAIGNRGIVISDGNDTKRFDEKIPEEIFNIRLSNFGFNRVQGIRTFRSRLNFWTLPSDDNPDGTFPDRVLVFNYETKTWAIFDDCFTCFGYFYPSESGETWAELDKPWESYNQLAWNSGISSDGFETVVAGNQQGYVFKLEQTSGQNDPSLSISAITAASPGVVTSINNNLPDETWITLSGIIGITSADGVSLNGRNFRISKTLTTDPDFTLEEYAPVFGGSASGLIYLFQIGYVPIIPGSVQINVGTTIVFRDIALDGILIEDSSLGLGTIDYQTGSIVLNFSPAIAASDVNIRVVTYDPDQGLQPVETIGIYGVGGEIAKVSNIEIDTKFFNFFGQDQSGRLSKIDFYVDRTSHGQLTCNILADSSDVPVNTPLSDNPESNIVLTSASPYQIGLGASTVYRLYADCVAQTMQLQLTFSDQQMAVNVINREDIELLAMMFTLRPGGRII